MKPIVAIVGRPNVGKSTLFNRLIGRRVAIVQGEPRITRDRIYGDVEWLGQEFILVDTGGMDFSKERIHEEVHKQAQVAMREADLIYFVIDGREGLTALDVEIGELLHRSQKEIILVINKMERRGDYQGGEAEYFHLGFSEIFPVSADHGQNIGDLLDKTIELLPPLVKEEKKEDTSIAIVGRPNVGKSSLVNALLGEDRVIVDEAPGTTRDAVDSIISRGGQDYRIIDTAGMRKRGRVKEDVEHYSNLRALRAIDRSLIVLLILDVEDGLNRQDKRIADYSIRQGKALIIIVNKMDLIRDPVKFRLDLKEEIDYNSPFLSFAPLVTISALYGSNLEGIWKEIHRVNEEHQRRITTGALNRVLDEATRMNQPPGQGKRYLNIYYGTQVDIRPPHFLLFVNDPGLSKPSYERYLENSLRQAFGFAGTPLLLTMKKRK